MRLGVPRARRAAARRDPVAAAVLAARLRARARLRRLGGQRRRERRRTAFLVLAPLLPLAGVAAAYGRDVDPTYEIGLAAPMRSFGLLLVRALAVLATTSVMAAVAGARARRACSWSAAAWLAAVARADAREPRALDAHAPRRWPAASLAAAVAAGRWTGWLCDAGAAVPSSARPASSCCAALAAARGARPRPQRRPLRTPRRHRMTAPRSRRPSCASATAPPTPSPASSLEHRPRRHRAARAPTAPARRRSCGCSRRCSRRPAGGLRLLGLRSRATPSERTDDPPPPGLHAAGAGLSSPVHGVRVRRLRRDPQGDDRRARAPPRGAPRARARSVSATSRAAGSASSRAACAAASRSRRRCSATRSCSCSTSRRPALDPEQRMRFRELASDARRQRADRARVDAPDRGRRRAVPARDRAARRRAAFDGTPGAARRARARTASGSPTPATRARSCRGAPPRARTATSASRRRARSSSSRRSRTATCCSPAPPPWPTARRHEHGSRHARSAARRHGRRRPRSALLGAHPRRGPSPAAPPALRARHGPLGA